MRYAGRISVQLDLPGAEIQGQIHIPGAGNITRISITRESEILLRNMTWVFACREVVNTWLTCVYDKTTLEPHYYVKSPFYPTGTKLA